MVGPFAVRAGYHRHTAIFGRRVGQRDPRRHEAVGLESHIEGVLVPAHVRRAVRLFDEQHGRVEFEIVAEQLSDAVDYPIIEREVGEERKRKVRVVAVFGVKLFWMFAFASFEFGEHLGRLCRGHDVDWSDPAPISIVEGIRF